MAEPKKFVTPTKKRRTMEVDLDGVTLRAREPKAASMVALAVLGEGTEAEQASVVNRFIDLVFDAESAEHLHVRLEDEDDDLDIGDLEPMVEWLSESFTARPTSLPPASGARRQPTKKRSTGGARSAG